MTTSGHDSKSFMHACMQGLNYSSQSSMHMQHIRGFSSSLHVLQSAASTSGNQDGMVPKQTVDVPRQRLLECSSLQDLSDTLLQAGDLDVE